MIAREKFAKPILFLLNSVFDKIFFIPEPLNDGNLHKIKQDISSFVTIQNTEKIDVLVNLSFCRTSSILCSLITSQHSLGLKRTFRNELVIEDQASQFLYSQVLGSEYCAFSLVDLYKKILGAPTNIDNTTLKNGTNNNIIIHPFASTLKKRWGIHKWIECIHQILSNNPSSNVFIVGSSLEKSKADEIIEHALLKKYSSRLTNLSGTSTFEDIDHLLSNCTLFIGHDSVVSHLAAKNKTKSVVISLGTVRPYETAPYNENALIVSPRISCFPCTPNEKCDLLPCHTKISPSSVSTLATLLIKNDDLNLSLQTENSLSSVDIFKVNIDKDLGLDLLRLSNSPQLVSDMYRRFYRILWSYQINEVEFFEPFPELSNDLIKSIEHTSHGIEKLYQLYQHSVDFTQQLAVEAQSREINSSKIVEFSQLILEADQLAQLIRKSFPVLSPIIDFTFTQKSSYSGPSLLNIAAGHIYTYEKALNSLMILTELMTKSIESSNKIKEKNGKKPSSLDL